VSYHLRLLQPFRDFDAGTTVTAAEPALAFMLVANEIAEPADDDTVQALQWFADVLEQRQRATVH
jgi:hypothetical protein